MGSAQSLLASQNVIAAIVLVAAIATTIRRSRVNNDDAITTVPVDKTASKKGKKKSSAGKLKDASKATSGNEEFPVPVTVASDNSLSHGTVPGGIPELGTNTSPASPSNLVKEKKRKGKKSRTPLPSGTPSESPTPVAGPSRPSTGSGSPHESPQPLKRPSTHSSAAEAWTRVESRRKASGANATTSDAGVTTATSVEEDGSSSGAVEKTGDDENNHSQKTLAEKLLPKGRKTVVDDMLESSHYPELSRVMRVAAAVNEKPATGFSWGDYEDVEEVRGADADGEDDGGWGVVKSRGKAKHSQPSSGVTQTAQVKAPETLTKRQRQHAAKKEMERALKVEAEVDRQARLARHKRDQERERISQQHSRKGPSPT